MSYSLESINLDFEKNFHAVFNKPELIQSYLKKRSNKFDEIIKKEFLQRELETDFALIALGGYGRKELFPSSDIDLSIIQFDRKTKKIEEIKDFIGWLWTLKVKVGHSVRTVKDIENITRSDLKEFTSYLSHRIIFCKKNKIVSLNSDLKKISKQWKKTKFFKAKKLEQHLRFQSFDSTEFSLEPDLKESPGCLRDFQTALWILEHCFELKKLQDCKSAKLFSTKEITNINQSYAHIKTLRFFLNLQSSSNRTKDLDEHGMIRIGAEVKPGDILIGKITPKGESDPTPEEKLLRAIFGDKAGDVKDASLKASPSLNGVVIDKKLFARSIKDKRKRAQNKEEISLLEDEFDKKFDELRDVLVKKLSTLISGKTAQGVINDLGEVVFPKGKKYTLKMLNEIDDYTHLTDGTWTTNSETNALVDDLMHNYKIKENDLQGNLRREKFAISVGDELPSGILKLAKVYVAKKRKLKVGDKMAGRHGNKGIVARIVRQEDMPFLEDGTPVDIVLNPLGVPSRMNIGQIYETVLGWAGQKLGQKYATPIFDGATIDEITSLTEKAGVPEFGHTYLYDGGTGQRFDQKATVGVIYMIKLGHMIDDKMHARSIGPYSLITQQPLGGKAQFGGQRFGEMEVWALEAYGASSTLREILTVKSDDVVGRAKTYEAIVKGEAMPEPGLPESFNVLMHELKGLGLDIRLEE